MEEEAAVAREVLPLVSLHPSRHAAKNAASWAALVARLATTNQEGSSLKSVATWVATVRCTYPTPGAGTCTPYVKYVGPGGKPPCASGTYPTREAGTRGLYVPNRSPGAYVSAQAAAR